MTTVGDGPPALTLLDESPGDVDLVVLDLMLPGMSGYAVCEAMRAIRPRHARADPHAPAR